MADLRTNFAGIDSPNPFWLASGPPTNTYGQVARAFDQGWGGAVWKTIGEPIINVFSRYGAVDLGQNRMMGFNNIELISDRPIADRKSTRLNSSHSQISYAVFCLKKKIKLSNLPLIARPNQRLAHRPLHDPTSVVGLARAADTQH